MDDYKNWVELQVKNKIRTYNRQRTGMAIFVGICMAILLILPALNNGGMFSICFSILCSALFMVVSLSFVLSEWSARGLFLITTIIMVAHLILTQAHFELLFILVLINIGTFLTSRRTSHRFNQSVTLEIETIHNLKVEATIDSLTQLLNRNGLEQAVETAWAICKRNQKNIGILLADIDYFKRYNDALGHLEGDKILKQVADRMRECFKRKTDIVSRIGGEEFIIFLPDESADNVIKMAQTLSSSITDLKIKAITSYPCDSLSISIGMATGIPKENDSFMDFYGYADKALYHAKENGRNCISYNQKIIKNCTANCTACSQGDPVDSVHSSNILGTGYACEDNRSR